MFVPSFSLISIFVSDYLPRSTPHNLERILGSQSRQKGFSVENLAWCMCSWGGEFTFEQTLDRLAYQRSCHGVAIGSSRNGTSMFVTTPDDHFDHKLLSG